MKKIMITMLVCISIIPFANAQKDKFGFAAGGTFGWMRSESEDGTKSVSAVLPAFSFGVVGDFPVGHAFSFQPALSFLQKGQSNSEGATSWNIRLNYLEMPLNFLYKTPGTHGHFVVGLGPAFSYGLSGTTSSTNNGQSETDHVHFGNSLEDLRSFEISGNILVGYEWKGGFFMQLNYNMGFSNLFPYDSQYPNDPGYMKNSYVGLRLGYFLGQK
jgi:hypothetical protein